LSQKYFPFTQRKSLFTAYFCSWSDGRPGHDPESTQGLLELHYSFLAQLFKFLRRLYQEPTKNWGGKSHPEEGTTPSLGAREGKGNGTHPI
jgi:hypothetical protein